MTVRKEYLADLDRIRGEITEMGQKTVNSVDAAVKSFICMNRDQAAASRQYEKVVDAMNAVIDKNCIITIATQAPAATDLRFLVATLKIASEIERVADYANNIAKSVQKRLAPEDIKPFAELMPDVEKLGAKAVAMLAGAVSAYQNSDAEQAGEIREQDAEVDALKKSILHRLAFIALSNSKEQAAMLEINNTVRYLERVADRATNIAEWVFYIATGFPAKQ